MKKIFFLIGLIFIASNIIAQELDATVTINTEQLPTASRDRLDNFKNQIQDYLNNNKFTSQPWQGERIKCNFTVFFISAADEVTYNAQLVVSSQRPIENSELNSLMLSIMDNSWSFKYEKGQAMYFNQTDFDPLTSLLDYYAYLIIGFDADSFDKLGGTDYFQKAFDIAVRGGSSKFAKGWLLDSSPFNRRALVENLLNAKYQQFRIDYFDYHYNGIDLINSKDKNVGLNNMIKLIKNLEKAKNQIDWRSVLLKVFFDAKAGEISEYLKGYADKSIFETLKKIDAPHTSKYDEALKVY
ncbi:MAG: DUF4835 family protein [Stygiobacter sp.]|uniref:DUF4835 family protein n=1 Tax=Stygiobacter electus TaxID=3032292 RepID=A0AAE3NZP0_9BACT|nr:DUF4835 family protein [Stygiobacter electus]MDF1611555.1 DUF4835 family protein [Stygiobacter electus]